MTLTELQARREDILKQMAAAKSVTFAERSVVHRDVADLERALQTINAEIAKAQGAPGGSVYQVTTGRGLA